MTQTGEGDYEGDRAGEDQDLRERQRMPWSLRAIVIVTVGRDTR
jgi:hypothetical protein